MRMIISSRCFNKNTFTQNTMEIQVQYEQKILHKKSLCQKCEKTANYGDPLFIFHPPFNFNSSI